jgi:glycine hydroxymethyltransferase
MEPGETLLYMELSHGGHLSHGHQTTKAKVSETAHKFNAVPYQVDLETGIIDYDGLRSLAMQHNAKVITVGGSSYSRLVNYERMRGIADLTGALLHCDMAHICGLVAGRAIESPFPFCDVVTTTTYKSFCGPKGAMIFYRNWMKDKINSTVFPRYQAARDYSVVLAISVALLEAQSQKYREQQSRVVAGSRILAACLYEYGYTLVGGGTDNHMVVINLKDSHIEASHAEKALEMVHVVCNQNSIPGDKGGTCSGLRLGTPPMVIRGLPPSAFRAVAGFVHQALELTRAIQDEVMQTVATGQSKVTKAKTMEQFTEACRRHPGIRSLGLQVWRLVSSYPPPWHN